MSSIEQLQRTVQVVPTSDRWERTRTLIPSRTDIVKRSVAQERDKGGAGAIKIILAGDGAVGKSTLVHRLCSGQFQARRVATIGVEFHVLDVTCGDNQTRLIVWDVGGQEQFAFTRRAFYRGGKGVALVYSTNDRRSYDRMPSIKQRYKKCRPMCLLCW